jgi:hypothetical protein
MGFVLSDADSSVDRESYRLSLIPSDHLIIQGVTAITLLVFNQNACHLTGIFCRLIAISIAAE